MEIIAFVKDYVKLANDPVVQTELMELSVEFNAKKKMNLHSPIDLLRQYIGKARRIVKPCIRNKANYEEIVWRHNLALDALARQEEGIKKQNREI